MGKARKKNSEDYEEDEDEDDEVDELEEDYVPSPRDRKSGGQGKSKASSIEPAGDAGVKGDAEPEAQLILIEELWVTCDRCDKWRLLPPGSIKPSENIPWFCALNPDVTRNRCDAPEQAWNEAGSVEIADKGPKKKASVGRPKSAPPQKGLQARAPDFSMGLSSAPRRRGRPPNILKQAQQQHHHPMVAASGHGGGLDVRAAPPVSSGPLLPPPRPAPSVKAAPKAFSTIAEELRALIAACNQILANSGSHETQANPFPPNSSGTLHQSLASKDISPPLWVWAGLHFYAPLQAKAASKALDVLTASEYGDAALAASSELGLNPHPDAPLPDGPATGMKAEEANARLMLMAAATVTLPRVEAALIYYPLPKKVQKQQQQSYQMPPGGPFMGGGMGMGMGMGGVGRGMGGEMMMMSPDAASLSPEMLSMMGAMFQQQQVAPTSLQNFGAQGVSSSLSAMQQPPIPFQPLAPAPLVPPPPPPLMSEAELNQLLQSLAHPPPPPPPLSMDFS